MITGWMPAILVKIPLGNVAMLNTILFLYKETFENNFYYVAYFSYFFHSLKKKIYSNFFFLNIFFIPILAGIQTDLNAIKKIGKNVNSFL